MFLDRAMFKYQKTVHTKISGNKQLLIRLRRGSEALIINERADT